MPRMDSDSIIQHGDPAAVNRSLIIGDGKIGKTWWAAMAAAFGWNVLYMDGDIGRVTLKKLPLIARQNIYSLSVGDTILDGGREPKMWETMKDFTSQSVFLWNDTKSQVSSRRHDEPDDEIWEIRPGKMDHRDVMLFDSWTSFTESVTLACAIEGSVQLDSATTKAMRPIYQMAGLKGTQMLTMLRSMRCHVIVLAHPDEFTHMTKPEGKKVSSASESDMVIDWTKMIPKSTSKPHGMQMGKYFTDIGWMETNASGTERLIDFSMSQKRMGGGSLMKRGNAETEHTFTALVEATGGWIPPKGFQPNPDHWLKVYKAGEKMQSNALLKPAAQVLDGRESTAIATAPKPGGMSALLAKKATGG